MLDWLFEGTALEWLSQGSLPIGILMFAGLFLGVAWRRLRARKATRDMPALAEMLGLAYKPSSSGRGMGTLSGAYRGYRVYVDPEEQRRITVRFEHSPEVDLRSYDVPRAAPPGMRTYFSGDKKFDAFFKTRFVGEQVAARLDAAESPRQFLEPFRGAYSRELKQVNVTDHGVSCVLDFGNPPHLPAEAVAHLLPGMLQLAELIEPHEEEGALASP